MLRMNSRFSKLVLIPCLLLFFGAVSAQKIVTTESGQKILIAKDGNWSIVKKTQTLDDDGNIVDLSGSNLDAFSAPSTGKYPLPLAERQMVENELSLLQSDEAQMMVNISFFMDKLEEAKFELRKAKKEDNDELIKSQSDNIDAIKESIKKTEKNYNRSSDLIADAQKLLDGKVKNPSKQIALLKERKSMLTSSSDGMGAAEEIFVSDEKTDVKENIGSEILIQNNVSYPTTFNIPKESIQRFDNTCEYTYDDFDEQLKAKRREVAKAFLFGFSQEKMKPYFKAEDFLTCEAHLSKVKKKTYLTLDIRIRSKEAKKTYGMLRLNETIRMQTINGKKVYLKNLISDSGTIEAYSGHTLYQGVYELSKDDINILKKEYLDNIGIVWSSGYEEYPIFEVDFIINQLSCLNK